MWMVLIRFVSTLSATARADGGRRNHVEKPALDTPSTRAIVTIGNTAWCALMNRKTRTLSCRSPVRTRPPLLPGSRAPDAAGGSHGADGPTQPAPPPVAHHRGGQHHVRLGAPNSRSLAPLARTRVTAPSTCLGWVSWMRHLTMRAKNFIANPCCRFRPRPGIFGSWKLGSEQQQGGE